MPKSLNLCFVLWGFGGIFGLHHLYLGRYIQFFLWFSSFGGFLIGWLGDLCQIPNYVAQANYSPAYAAAWEMRRGRGDNRIRLSRIIGSYVFSIYFEVISVYALDVYEAYYVPLAVVFVRSVVRALAVYACFSIGERRCSFKSVLISSIASEVTFRELMRYFLPIHRLGNVPGDVEGIGVVILSQLPIVTTIIAALLTGSYKDEKAGRSLCFCLPVLIICLLIWIVLFTSAIYHHLEVPISRSDSKMLKEVLSDFRASESYNRLLAARKIFTKLRKDRGFRYAAESLSRTFGLLGGGVKYDSQASGIQPPDNTSLFEVSTILPGIGAIIRNYPEIIGSLQDMAEVCWIGNYIATDIPEKIRSMGEASSGTNTNLSNKINRVTGMEDTKIVTTDNIGIMESTIICHCIVAYLNNRAIVQGLSAKYMNAPYRQNVSSGNIGIGMMNLVIYDLLSNSSSFVQKHHDNDNSHTLSLQGISAVSAYCDPCALDPLYCFFRAARSKQVARYCLTITESV